MCVQPGHPDTQRQAGSNNTASYVTCGWLTWPLVAVCSLVSSTDIWGYSSVVLVLLRSCELWCRMSVCFCSPCVIMTSPPLNTQITQVQLKLRTKGHYTHQLKCKIMITANLYVLDWLFLQEAYSMQKVVSPLKKWFKLKDEFGKSTSFTLKLNNSTKGKKHFWILFIFQQQWDDSTKGLCKQ